MSATAQLAEDERELGRTLLNGHINTFRTLEDHVSLLRKGILFCFCSYFSLFFAFCLHPADKPPSSQVNKVLAKNDRKFVKLDGLFASLQLNV